MKGITLAKAGGPEVLQYEDVPIPKLEEGQVMIEVHATALNGADLLQRAGNYPPPPGVASSCFCCQTCSIWHRYTVKALSISSAAFLNAGFAQLQTHWFWFMGYKLTSHSSDIMTELTFLMSLMFRSIHWVQHEYLNCHQIDISHYSHHFIELLIAHITVQLSTSRHNTGATTHVVHENGSMAGVLMPLQLYRC